MTRRESFIKAGLELMGLSYGWGFKGYQQEPYRGRDCSGLVTSSLLSAGGPDLREWNCAAMFNGWPPFASDGVALYFPPLPGDLIIYEGADGAPHHVMIHLGVGELVFGASGGDETTLTQAEALRRGARVQIHESKDYRPGFLGYRRIPWLDA